MQKPFGGWFRGLPDRGLIGGAMALLLVMPLVVRTPIPTKGFYVHLSAANYADAGASGFGDRVIVKVLQQKNRVGFLLNGKEVPREKLSKALKPGLSKQAEPTVFVEGDADLPYFELLYVIDVASGLRANVVLLTGKAKK